MRAALLVLVMLLLSAAVFSAPAPRGKAVNLLVNGSFEEGPAVANYMGVTSGDTSIKGWVVTRDSIDIVDSYWQAANGKRSIDLHGSPGFGGISQTFATRPGRIYEVTFSLAANPDGGMAKKEMAVTAAGKSAAFTFDPTGSTRPAMRWAKKTWRFTAEKERTTLELHTLMKIEDATGPVIDDVCVMEVR